jgi:hypothetical protein
MSIVGGHGGSYRKVNPQLSQTVESMKIICQSLNRAPDNWWKTAPIQITTSSADNQQQQDEDDNKSDGSGEENAIDFNTYQSPPPQEESSASENEESDWEH